MLTEPQFTNAKGNRRIRRHLFLWNLQFGTGFNSLPFEFYYEFSDHGSLLIVQRTKAHRDKFIDRECPVRN